MLLACIYFVLTTQKEIVHLWGGLFLLCVIKYGIMDSRFIHYTDTQVFERRDCMVNKTDAIEIITYAEENGIAIWIDGGWGVDALLK
jgi:hypothetical protein